MDTCETYIIRLEEDNRISLQTTRDNKDHAMKTSKHYHDRTAQHNKYTEGDTLLHKDNRDKVKGTAKLSDKWIGLYFIVDCLENVFRCTLSEHDKGQKIIHHDNLKLYLVRDGEQPDNTWVFKVFRTQRKPVIVRGYKSEEVPLTEAMDLDETEEGTEQTDVGVNLPQKAVTRPPLIKITADTSQQQRVAALNQSQPLSQKQKRDRPPREKLEENDQLNVSTRKRSYVEAATASTPSVVRQSERIKDKQM